MPHRDFERNLYAVIFCVQTGISIAPLRQANHRIIGGLADMKENRPSASKDKGVYPIHALEHICPMSVFWD